MFNKTYSKENKWHFFGVSFPPETKLIESGGWCVIFTWFCTWDGFFHGGEASKKMHEIIWQGASLCPNISFWFLKRTETRLLVKRDYISFHQL